MTANRTLGNAFESKLCEMLSENGFWVHNLAQNHAGQPADIIAVRENRAVLIDCKVCSNGRFDTDRIESNQLGSMMVWKEAGNMEWWFALQMPDESVYMVPGDVAEKWVCLTNNDTIYWRDLKDKFATFERWVKRFENRYWERIGY